MTPQPEGEFAGDVRFTLLGRIGAGGMGVVYKAMDKERGSVVALKTLRSLGPAAIFRLKQEFRALADVTHPNLVALHELVQSGESWFLTMEYVEGTNFLAWVRGGGRGSVAFAETMTSVSSGPATPRSDPRVLEFTSPPSSERGGSTLFEPRLRAAFAQLALGVATLHAAGKLHRDLKPSNVLVTPEGRVVILDFGLVTELGAQAVTPDSIAGTAAYMAPEQVAARPLDEASDWYAVGVMLYEALTGRRPFVGPAMEVLVDKQHHDPVPPGEHAPDAPADLALLCMQLLQREPARRPTGPVLLHELGVETAATPRSWGARVDDAPLVGRAAELAVLEDAFAQVAAGRTVVTVVHGPSGIGKSRLVRGFLEGLRGRALVLNGRCHERESVPFKAVDSLVDALCTHLLGLPRATADSLLPADMDALMRVFPVLWRIDAVSYKQRATSDLPDVSELRRHAFAALRELLGRLQARAPLVLFVDDLQWGDADSGALLDALLAAPDPPALLLIGCHRAEDPGRRPVLRTLLAARPGVELRDLELGPLSADESRELASRLLDGDGAPVEAIAREAGGSPFFLLQLAQQAQTGARDAERVAHERAPLLGLDEMLGARLALLTPPARALLEVIALAARPIPQAVALAAAGLPAGDQAELERLRAARLVRTDGAKARDAVECYHDRIRDAATLGLTAQARRQLHGRLAQELERDPTHAESLAEHFSEAGDLVQAGRWATVAADRAAATLAFDRAAELYRRALSTQAPGNLDERRELQARLADTLVAAGRGVEAARAFLEAARGAAPALSLARRHKAAEQLMHSGHVDEGSATLHGVLRELGVRAPVTRAGAVASLIANRTWIRLRGHRYHERRAEDVPAQDLLRLDVYWSAMTGFSLTSHLHATAFQARHAREAFAAGEPGRLAIAFAGEAFFFAHQPARAREFAERAHQLAERSGDPAVEAMVLLFDGWRFIELGLWARASEVLAGAEQLLRERCRGHAWARDTAQIFGGIALGHQGRLAEQRRHIGRILRDAKLRGDLYLSASVPYHLYLSDLASDEPEALHEAVRAATSRGLPRDLGTQHWGVTQAEACASLYEGDPGSAYERVESMWPGLRRTLLLHSVAFRREALFVRGRTAVATLARDRGRARIAAEMIGKLERDRTAATRAIGALLAASLLQAQGQPDHAASAFDHAAAALEAQAMTVLAAAARWRRGELIGGAAGAALVSGAKALLTGEGVRRPERLMLVLAPLA